MDTKPLPIIPLVIEPDWFGYTPTATGGWDPYTPSQSKRLDGGRGRKKFRSVWRREVLIQDVKGNAIVELPNGLQVFCPPRHGEAGQGEHPKATGAKASTVEEESAGNFDEMDRGSTV